MMNYSTQMNTEEESTELIQFREEWRQEVRQRQREEQQAQQASAADPNQPKVSPFASLTRPPLTNHTPSPIRNPRTTVLDSEGKQHPTWSVAGVPQQSVQHTSHGQDQLTGSLARAVEIYSSALQHEQESNLNEALRLYRQAFRLNPDVDRAHFKEEERLRQLTRYNPSVDHKKPLSVGRAEGAERKATHVARVQGREKAETTVFLSGLLAGFPQVLAFEPEDEREGVPINIVPVELLLYILRNLDTTTLERFAAISRKARVLSLDSSLWRNFVYMAYKPPQIPGTDVVEMIVNGYNASYRQTYIEHPRLRLDGAYIAVCHYVRTGLSENAWVNVGHLVTYHRYLRFFPDGQVLSLLANEEYQPSLVIPMLKPSLRMKGFYIGEWRLEGSTVLICNLVEMHSLTHASPTHHHNHVPQPRRYHFQMTLSLRSKPLGRWNKLDLVSYESVNVEDGEVVPLPLKHERPFWFSKVKSWPGY
ncbi:hypothetical protein PAXRUDRAFT_822351 [Paxillus rubicundulus Ve08.2h10]|uniref:F-box only protein 9 n=1 Tax=Paxillus rubicundulus Ve08.2h10 TaxID=930991 RepID=A0A0D0DM89_9AGAM|nr:hypothetical protein PAXRUDRAFT_822351 [Paxillus rubicundulus Ve08.2h10]